MADATSLQTRLTRAECDERIQARLDRRAFTFTVDPARPVRGRSSIQGFALRHPRDAIVEATGTYLLGSGGGTRIDVSYRLPLRTHLWWLVLNVVVLGIAGGVVFAATRRTGADPFAVFLVGVAFFGMFMLLVQVVLVALSSLVYGPRQRAYLRRVIEETLAAR